MKQRMFMVKNPISDEDKGVQWAEEVKENGNIVVLHGRPWKKYPVEYKAAEVTEIFEYPKSESYYD